MTTEIKTPRSTLMSKEEMDARHKSRKFVTVHLPARLYDHIINGYLFGDIDGGIAGNSIMSITKIFESYNYYWPTTPRYRHIPVGCVGDLHYHRRPLNLDERRLYKLGYTYFCVGCKTNMDNIFKPAELPDTPDTRRMICDMRNDGRKGICLKCYNKLLLSV